MSTCKYPLSIVTAIQDILAPEYESPIAEYNVATLHICEDEEIGWVSTSRYATEDEALEAARLLVPLNRVVVPFAEFYVHREYQRRYCEIYVKLASRMLFISNETEQRYINETAFIRSVLSATEPGLNYPATTTRRRRTLELVDHLDHLRREDNFWAPKHLGFLYNWTDDNNE